MHNLSTDEIQATVHQLDQAIYNHEQWSQRLARTLICRTWSDDNDLSDDAHRRCLFGQWYYGRAPIRLQAQPGFVAIGSEHQLMHAAAARLLQNAAIGAEISPVDYDAFENILGRMRLQVHTLRRECTEMMYNRDPLTGTNSRYSLLTSLREYHDQVRRGLQICSIAMMDMDHFKAINDQYGHLVGDKVLSASAGFLMNNTRSYDKVFRFGGEEFLICTPGLSTEQAFSLIERLRCGIADIVTNHAGEKIRATASFGITSLNVETTVEHCLEFADKALYEAKSAGRNCSLIWEDKSPGVPPLTGQ